MPVQGRPTRIHDLVSMVYGNGGAMVLPNYGMNDARQLDELPNGALVEQEGFVFEELLELTSLAEQAGLLEPVVDLTEERVNEEGDTAPVTTLYALTPQGTGVARERADAAHRAALEEAVEGAAASAAEQATERALDALDAVTVEVPEDAVSVEVAEPARPSDGEDPASGEDRAATDETEAQTPEPADGAAATGDAGIAVSGDVARAVTVFAAALVLVATADATRGLLREALPEYTTAITAALLSLYAVVLIFVVRTAYRVGSAADGDTAPEEPETEEGAAEDETEDDGDSDGEDGDDGGDSDGEDGDDGDLGGDGGDEGETDDGDGE